MTNRDRNTPARREQPSSDRSFDEAPDVADDRGFSRDRRSFGGDREHDELGSEMDDSFAVEDSDDMAMDDGLGGPDRDEP
jgi:hypothetical protein